MRTQISRWGNSLAIRIPGAIVRSHGLEAGDAVELTECEDGTLQLRSDGPGLSELIERITPDNLHDECSFGAPVGKELL